MTTPEPSNTSLGLLRAATQGALCSAAFNGTFFVGGQAMAVASFGNRLLLELGIVCLLGILPALAAIPLSALAVLVPSARQKASRTFLFALAYVAVFYGCVLLAHEVRSQAFTALARRSGLLVEAIRAYEARHSSPPGTLEALVPDFLPSLPKTGLGAYPDYEFSSSTVALSAFPPGNSWVLYVHTPSGGINFDRFFYLPRENYPERVGGDPIQRIEDWAYLHE